MKLVRLGDLSATFTDNGKVRLRSWAHGFSVLIPASAMQILAFCSSPRDEAEVSAAFGSSGCTVFRRLAETGLLVDPADAETTPVFFTNFAAVDLHRRMLGDKPRIEAYKRALHELAPGRMVLDAGTGSGVLAGLAALSGARGVVGVDNSEIIEAAAENMRRSNLADRVQLIRGDIAEIVTEEPVDLIVTETFGAMALVEGAADDVARCAANNLAPAGTVMPHAIDFYLAPVSDAEVRQEIFGPFSSVSGLNLSVLAEAAEKRAVTMAIAEDSLLTPGVRFCRLPFPGQTTASGAAEFICPSGEVVGLAGWFDLHLSPTQILSTGPAAPLTVWGQTYFPLGPFPVADGEVMRLVVTLGPAPDSRRDCLMELEWEAGERSGRTVYRLG